MCYTYGSKFLAKTYRMTLQAKQITQQRLMLAPNVTLALEILRMPTLELRAFLEHQMEDNPLLELDELTDDESPAETSDTANQSEDPPANGWDEEWLSHWRTVQGEDDPEDETPLEDRLRRQAVSSAQTLFESLQIQLGCLAISEELRKLGERIIEHLDEHGYLEGTLEELATELGADSAQLEEALRSIQQLDPPGVGARDLRECLMLQLERQEACGGLAYQILKEHFPLFTERRLNELVKATGAAADHVTNAIDRIKALNPKPGRLFSGDLPPCVTPDLIIHRREQHYDVELNDQDVPQLLVSREYYRMLRDPRTPADAKEFLSTKFRQASWLIKAIDERNTTLLAIARCLISLQRDFLEQGLKAIKPLTQAQVAGLIGRHPSTVSRAITGKTIDTPCGIFRLEQLFASSVPQADSSHQTVSDETIKSEIQRLIAEEDPHRPLSDSALVARLTQRQVCVARRTIAKYRTSLKILPAHLRKHRL